MVLPFQGCSTPCVQLLLADIPWPWYVKHLGVSNAIQTSLSQPHAIASQGLHAGTPLPHTALPQWFSLTTEEESTAPLAHISFMTRKPEPCEQHCQIWLPSWDIAWPP